VIAHHADKDAPAHLKEKILSKIIEIQETRFDTSSRVDEEMAEFCNGNASAMKVSRIGCSNCSSRTARRDMKRRRGCTKPGG
jgi:hypothetical protein